MIEDNEKHLFILYHSSHSNPSSFSYLYWTGLGVCLWKHITWVKTNKKDTFALNWVDILHPNRDLLTE